MNPGENITNFHTQSASLSPTEVYTFFKQNVPTDKNHLYITGPINTGGAVRLHSFEGLSPEDVDSTIELIATENVVFASILIKMLTKMRLIKDHSVVTSPYFLGKSGERRYQPANESQPRRWSQSEYLLFWSMVISGIAVEATAEFYQAVETEMKDHSAKMNTLELPRPEKIAQYQYMEEVVLSVLNELPSSSYQPVNGLIKFPDSGYSLGSIFEQRLAMKLNIPTSKVVFNLGHPFFTMLHIYKDKVFQCLLGIEDGLAIINDDSRILPIEIVPANDKPTYRV